MIKSPAPYTRITFGQGGPVVIDRLPAARLGGQMELCRVAADSRGCFGDVR